MQLGDITTQLAEFAVQWGFKLKHCSLNHWQLTFRKGQFNVHYGRKGFCAVESHGWCNIRTATLSELLNNILEITRQTCGAPHAAVAAEPAVLPQPAPAVEPVVVTIVRDKHTNSQGMYIGNSLRLVGKTVTAAAVSAQLGDNPVVFRFILTALGPFRRFPLLLQDCPPAVATTLQDTAVTAVVPAKPTVTSREWATEFVERHKRFPHALDYADAGYDQGSQCDCRAMGECVLRDATVNHCDRNCYTQQLQDYIAMSDTKRSHAKVEEHRPATVESLLEHIHNMKTRHDADTVYIPKWAEDLLLQGAALAVVRRTMYWQANSWRPRTIHGLTCVWDADELRIV